jgi:hypothetical protein
MWPGLHKGIFVALGQIPQTNLTKIYNIRSLLKVKIISKSYNLIKNPYNISLDASVK